jgi:hypothetical protein
MQYQHKECFGAGFFMGGCACAGQAIGKSPTTSWSSLPNDMVDVILANLSLIELAELSRTCTSFNAVYRRLIAQEQKARRNLAVNCCRLERIRVLARLTGHLLKDEVLHPCFFARAQNAWWISADGVLHGPVCAYGVRQLAREAGDIFVWMYLEKGPPAISNLFVEVTNCTAGQVTMQFNGERKGVTIYVFPTSQDDLAVVSVVQAMLSEGLADFVHEVGSRVEIRIRGPIIPGSRITPAGLKAQIAPLLSFASRYTPLERRGWRGTPWRSACKSGR